MESSSCWRRIREEGHYVSVAKGKTSRVAAEALEYGSFVSRTSFASHGRFSSLPIAIFLDFCSRDILIHLGTCCMELLTKELEGFVLVSTSEAETAVYITLRHPPRLFDHEDPGEELEYARRLSEVRLSAAERLERQTLASCRTVKLSFYRRADGEPHPVVATLLDFLCAVEKTVYEAEVKTVPADTSSECELLSKTRHADSWEVYFAWLCLQSAAGFVKERFGASFFTRLEECREKLAASVLHALARMMNGDLFVDPLEAFDAALRGGYSTRDIQDAELHCRLPRLVLTPTRRIFYEAEIIQTNRVLREWGHKAEFLRVIVRDENFQKLSSTKGKLDNVLNVIVSELMSDLKLGSKRFRFLGCSNNQVRDHGCFFIDATKEPHIVEKIRAWAGNLEYITNVAKYVSRLGQVFSTSTNTVTVDPSDCTRIPDIERNGYCFTEGIGKISQDLAEEVWQIGWIRFGGCKGVVAVDRNVQQQHRGKRLCIRQSMLKYWSSHTTIEVLSSCARPQELFLNQQLIMLLSYLGVPDRVFLKLMKDTLTSLSSMFIDEEVARSKLKSVSCGIDWDAVVQSNYMITTDPYLRSMLMALYRLQMKGLREKSRIAVDSECARVLIGTVDETQSLEYGQVFVQYSKYLHNPGVEKPVLQRKVVIGKSPCLHPGDVRTFDAVDCSALHHMCDCVVFPSKGHRPHPNELSGSDLDGDLYHVIWADDLMPTVPNKSPMDYTPAVASATSQGITSDKMLHFLRQNIEYDCLGQIDNTHKALADQIGIDSESCLQLAKLHSQAVDAPKTGLWTSVPRFIRKMLDKYPDFMMKQDKPSYPSEKILGVMYRECTKLLNACSVQRNYFRSVEAALDQNLFQVEGMQSFLDEARRLRKEYNTKLRALMSMYGVSTEAEFMTGFAERLHEKIGKEVPDVTSLISRLKRRLLEKYRDIFCKVDSFLLTSRLCGLWLKDERIQRCGIVHEEKAVCKAAAWYQVCYSPVESCEKFAVGKTETRFYSFAWIASDYLMKLYLKNCSTATVDGAKERIGRSIYSYLERTSGRLLHIFGEQLVIKSPSSHPTQETLNGCADREHLEGALSTSEPVVLPFLYGLSYTMLFDERAPEVEIVLWVSGLDRHLFEAVPVNPASQKELMHLVRRYLQNSGADCRVATCGKRQMLQFNLHVPALRRYVKGHLTVDPLSWLQSALLLEYIYHNPWLLPLLRVIIKWSRATDLVGAFKNALIGSLPVCLMLIDYGLRCGAIQQPIDAKEILESFKKAEFNEFARVDVWEEVLSRLFTETAAAAPMGDLLLGFFSEKEQSALNPVHPALVPVLGHNYYWQTCSMEATKLLQEEMQRAFHKLSFHCAIEPLFFQVETEKVLHLPPPFSQSMIGSEQFFARLYAKQTRTKVEIHRRGGKEDGLLIKITGSQTGIHSVETLLDQFKNSSSALKTILATYPGVLELFTADSHRCVFEGITDGSEKKLSVEDYWGARHPIDDNKGLYVIHVLSPSELSPCERIPQGLYDLSTAKFLEFKDFFLRRISLIHRRDTESYSPIVHGPLTFQIYFGKMYLVHPPKEMMEDPEGVSVEQLVLHLQQGKTHQIQQIHRWRQEIDHPATAPDCKAQTPRLAFFPKLHQAISHSALEHLLLQEYGMEETPSKECHVLSLRGQCHGVVAAYAPNLSVTSISYPPIRWMLVDIKRSYSEWREADIRYAFTSRAACNVPLVRSKVAGAIHRRAVDDGVTVSQNLTPSVHSLKHMRRREFQFRKAHGSSPFWKSVTVVWSEMAVMSRPKMPPSVDFDMRERFYDLRLVIDLEKFSASVSDQLIGEMWFQALYLSDTLLQLAKQRQT